MLASFTVDKLLSKWEFGLASIGKLLSDRISQPVFVIGTGRCGSTLFSQVLDSHRQLAVFPYEPNKLWFPKSYPYRTTLIDTPSILQDPKQYTKLSLNAWPKGQVDKIRNSFNGYHALRGGARILIIKSAMISFMIPRLLEVFPDARFVHLYRNGVSVVASLQKKEWHKYRSYTTEEQFVLWCARYWNSCIAEIDRMNEENSLSARNVLFELSYEAFCDNPKLLIKQLSDFIKCDPDGFLYDFSTVVSTNYKAQNYKSESSYDLQELMAPSMRLKGYI